MQPKVFQRGDLARTCVQEACSMPIVRLFGVEERVLFEFEVFVTALPREALRLCPQGLCARRLSPNSFRPRRGLDRALRNGPQTKLQG